jgi:hypothetical protein
MVQNFLKKRACRQASMLPDHNEVLGDDYKAVEYVLFTVYK